MTVLVSDPGTGSGALGTSAVGGRPFVQFPAGAFTRAAGGFVTGQAVSANPMAVVDVGFGDVDVSCSVDGNGGDCLYFRVRDGSNWLRLRVHSWQSGTNSGTNPPYWDGTYDVGEWQYQGSSCFLPGDGGYTMGNTYYNYVGGYPTTWVANAGTVCYEEPGHYPGRVGGTYTRSVTQHMVGGGSYSYPIYSYETVLEQSVAGTVTSLATWPVTPSTLRVVDDRSNVTVYINGAAKTPVAVRSANGGTRVGVGRGGPTTLNGTGLKNLSVSIRKTGWGAVA